MSGETDEKDEEILEQLAKDSRQSTADISRKTGIPRMTVHERIKKLTKGGVIKQFTIKPDYSKLSKPVTAFILVAYAPGHKMAQETVAAKIAKLPGVYDVYIMAGEWDMLLKARASSIEDMGNLVVRKIRDLEGVSKTYTMPVFLTVSEQA
ncbi:MAG: Lrp/AsnC family transcriptional regulator [Candidatus Micrarchaeia archaeon]|jgi:DNA-binding Lrp family transcriptional regulator